MPKDFITLEQAIKLIERGTQAEPTVDLDFLIPRVRWIEPAHNFTIPLVTVADGKLERTGYRFVEIADDYAKNALTRAIYAQYKKFTGEEYEEAFKSRKISSVITDDENGGNSLGVPIETLE